MGLGRQLFIYVARHTLRPALLALLGLSAALLAKDLLGSAELAFNRGLGVVTVGKMLLFQLVPLVSVTLPFAIAIGLFAGLGRLSSTLELTAMESSGIAPRALIAPILAVGLLGSVLALALSFEALPRSAQGLRAIFQKIQDENPSAAVVAGTTLDFGGWKLEAREVTMGGRAMRGVLLWIPSVGDTIFAEGGRVETPTPGHSELYLHEGAILRRAGHGVERVLFEQLETVLPSAAETGLEDLENPLRLLSWTELGARSEDHSLDSFLRRSAALEQQRRLALPFAALIFSFLAVPLFLHLGRPQGATGALIGLVLTLSYYGLLQFGEGLVHGEHLGALAGAWFPNGVGALAALLALTLPSRPPRRAVNRGAGRAYVGGTTGLRIRRRPLDRYVGRSYVTLTLAAFLVFFFGYLLIDVLERLAWFERYDATTFEILHFYSARAPLLASRMVPMAFLAGAALTVSRLAVRGELLAMRSCGIAVARGLAPILVVALLSVPAAFALNDILVPRTNALADEIKVSEIKAGVSRAVVWFRAGKRVIRALSLDPILGRASDLTIYEMGDAGLPDAITAAATATRIGESDSWKLQDAIRYELSTEGMLATPAPIEVELSEDEAGAPDTMHLDSRALVALIDEAERDGYDATAFRVDYHVRMAYPWACFVLPTALLFLILSMRSLLGKPAVVMLLAIGMGVVYMLMIGVGATLGLQKAIPPVAAGWGLNGLFGLLSVALALRNAD